MLVRWSPFSEMDTLLSSFGRSSSQGWVPAFDVVEEADKVTLHADVPGLEEKSLDIHVDGNLLTVKGSRQIERRDAKPDLYRRYERTEGNFERSFRLAPSVDAQGITADLKGGVLTLTLPKRPEAQPRQIKVSVKA